jgi:hypothetical protein
MNDLSAYAISQETGLEYLFVQRVIKKMNLKPIGSNGRTDTYDLVEFTAALKEYKDRPSEAGRKPIAQDPHATRSLEDIRLEEIIRGLILKNDELEKKLVPSEFVKEYLFAYRSFLLVQLKDILTTRFPNTGDGQKAIKLRSLGVSFYNSLVDTMNQYTNKWIASHNLKGEVKEHDDYII